MHITFLGGADEVGASSILLATGGRRLLIDAGIRLSPKTRWGLSGDQLPDLGAIDRAGGVDAILVTHAHTDHTGALALVAERYSCPIYATPVTIALSRVLLADARRIMQTRLDEEGELPLYDDVAVQKLLAAWVPVPFNTRFPLADGLIATFFPAGHIAGAAMVGIAGDQGRVLVTGDVSITAQRTVDGARLPPFRPDVLITECTYGGRLHANRATEERRLVDTVAQVVAAGGKVLIPAFALGRAQEVILTLSEFRRRGEWEGATVWVDGMVRAICQVYARFPEALPLALQERGALFFDKFTRPVERAEQRADLIWQADPLVVVASSGMLAGGASTAYARVLAKQPQNAILLTGYQDEESPGRHLLRLAQRGSGTLKLGKDKVDVQCRLGLYSLSAHADEGQLINLVEALEPSEVVLVHGDESARQSLWRALSKRGRSVHLPHNGQSLEFRLAPPPGVRRPSRIGGGQPLDARALWKGIAGPVGGGYFTTGELSQAWWGDEYHVEELEATLARDDLYFVPLSHRRGVYRARTKTQVELSLERRARMTAHDLSTGQLLILRDPQGKPYLARCAAVALDHFYVAGDPTTPRWPEALLAVIEPSRSQVDLAAVESLAESLLPTTLLPPNTPRPLDDILASLPDSVGDRIEAQAAVTLALLLAGAECTPEGYLLETGAMEPNQALAFIRERFPPTARLRRCGYHLDRRTITLAFDFPDVARERYADVIQGLPGDTGWQIEIDPQANQAALSELAREEAGRLGLHITKGPALHLDQKRVTITAHRGDADDEAMAQLCRQFRETSGYELSVQAAVASPASVSPGADRPPIPGQRWEINAAQAAIKQALAGSTLYRTSLKGGRIILSFISPQVGRRYQAEIEALAEQVGWPLDVNPQPNQGLILETARNLVRDAGWEIVKGPGLHQGRSEVKIRLVTPPDEAARAAVETAFEAQTGYRLVLDLPAAPVASPASQETAEIIVIPLDRIRLQRFHRSAQLKPEKVRKAVDRARRRGAISPPILVRRLRKGYLLLDGLYRLHAARQLGWEQIQATIEHGAGA